MTIQDEQSNYRRDSDYRRLNHGVISQTVIYPILMSEIKLGPSMFVSRRSDAQRSFTVFNLIQFQAHTSMQKKKRRAVCTVPIPFIDIIFK